MLERRAGGLGIAILLSIIIVGKMFGGALKGLIPLGMVLASGVWLWMKEVVRSGREVEWSSEQARGETVCTEREVNGHTGLINCPGNGEPPSGVG